MVTRRKPGLHEPQRGRVQGNPIRLATAQTTANGLTRGDLLFGNPSDSSAPGRIGWASANGSPVSLNWLTLPGPYTVAGDLYVDQTGIWGNNLLAVTGTYDWPMGNHGVWQINPQTRATNLVASIYSDHLEGLLTLSNDTRYGPWAGKLITADENTKLIYAVDPNGVVQAFGPEWGLGISADTFRLVPASQNLYCCADAPGDYLVLELSSALLSPYVGDILAVQSGEVGQGPAALYIIHWNGSSFTTKTILLGDYFDSSYWFEKAAFAPVDVPPVPYP